MTPTYAELRANYPAPRRIPLGKWPDNTYCIGGVLCLGVGYNTPFPEAIELADVLQRYYGFDEVSAWEYAREVIQANDEERWEDAWGFVKLALDKLKQVD